jgi:hypothetical protein
LRLNWITAGHTRFSTSGSPSPGLRVGLLPSLASGTSHSATNLLGAALRQDPASVVFPVGAVAEKGGPSLRRTVSLTPPLPWHFVWCWCGAPGEKSAVVIRRRST